VTSEAREPLPEAQEQLVGPAVVAASPVDDPVDDPPAGTATDLRPPDEASAGWTHQEDVFVGVGPRDDAAGGAMGGEHSDGAQPGMSRSTAVLLVSGFATVLLAAAAALLPVPYAALKPGPAINTLGNQNGKPLITVIGHATYPVTGNLALTTVTVVGGPAGKLTVADLIVGVLDPTVAVVPESDVFPSGQTQQQTQQQNQQEMATSQEQAAAAALTELGIKVPTTLTVSEVMAGAPAATVLRHGDVLLAIDGVRTDDLTAVRDELQKVDKGEPVTVTVRRDGKEQNLVTRTRVAEGRTVLGILIDPAFHFPFTVKIQIDDVGGPSAGMMFALGIIDVLTPGAMTGGQSIAGTGTIDSDGTVGAIGGIQEKMIGARSAGARWFLAPADDCAEVVGHVPDGLHVVRVSTLHQARQAVSAIASGSGDSLPTCRRS
jgi:PDZ domain-containing protein